MKEFKQSMKEKRIEEQRKAAIEREEERKDNYQKEFIQKYGA